MIGGSAVPAAMIEAFQDEHGVDVIQGWGMTEMQPGRHGQLAEAATRDSLPLDRHATTCRSSRARRCTAWRCGSSTTTATTLPHDGKSVGGLQVRGPWIAQRLLTRSGGRRHATDGWFDTGDVATIDADGYLQITDRAKDIIKSGGEWISSIDLENVAMRASGDRGMRGRSACRIRNGRSGRCSSSC